MNDLRAGSLCVVAAAVLWGFWPAWVRGGGSGAASATVALLVAGVVGLPLALRERAHRAVAVPELRPTARDFVLVALLGVSNALNTWFYFRALAEGAVAPAVLSHYLAPVLVALFAPFFLRERTSPRTPLALVLALAGTAVLLLGAPGDGRADGQADRHAAWLGGSSAVFYAAAVLLSKAVAPRFGNAELFSYHALVATLVLLLLGGIPRGASGLAWPALGALVSGLFAGMIYYEGLRRIPAERVGVLTYVEPVAAVVVGWVVFGEAPGLAALLGGGLVTAGGLLVVSQEAET